MAAYLRSLGGEVRTGVRVRRLRDVPPHRVALFDTDASQLALIARNELPHRFRRRLRGFRNGPGAFKIDYALDGPVPWSDPACARAGTVHVGGRMAEIAAAELDIHRGRMPDRPFVLVGQQSVVDPTRAPAGRHTLWVYAHVPFAHHLDATEAIERQIARFAPDFRDRVLARHVTSPAAFERYNPNYVGGDIATGSHAGLQLFFRPTVTRNPYATPDPAIWICSAASPPGAGVHGMCGHNAANAVLAGPLG
jgi:phytoene dehydrogenase-like protein